MITIVGLGNPGEKFKNTRHNVGFVAVDAYAAINDFPAFELEKKFDALVSEKDNVILAKPQTFMNESGKSVKKLLTKNNTDGLVVIHDDIDLPVGKIKIVKERGSAGHKGVESIIQNVGNDGLIRIRVGIGGQEDTKAMKIVLKNFSWEEQKKIDGAIQKTSDALSLFIKEGLEKAMNEYNK